MKTLLWICGTLLIGVAAGHAASPLIVHEWGTLTALEDEDGQPIPGINADDEPVPAFVHRITSGLILPSNWIISKGIPEVHPDVTMRLETPVVYVHAPPGFQGTVDVRVQFPGGWLTEYYPDAQAKAPGIDLKYSHVGHISPKTVGALEWTGLKIGGSAAGPATVEPVWLAPRNVAADTVRTESGESEKFLFYRGVGCQKPFFSIAQDPKDGTVHIANAFATLAPIPPFWLVDVRPDGSAAYQLANSSGPSRPFIDSDYGVANIPKLRASIETALIQAGLYQDEAEALLNTWQNSYFKSPGLRVFYLWPSTMWSNSLDVVLPLAVTPGASIKRVMLGRIELVTPAERETIEKIGAADPSGGTQLFASLGRFRAALLLDEERRHPSPGLENFMKQNNVAYYQP